MEQRTSSRTNKDQDARVKLEDEQAQQQPKKPKAQPKRQPRKQVEKPQEEEPINIHKSAPKEPSKSKKIEARFLNLDLSDVPPSDDIKFSKDFSFYTHPFWKDIFNTQQEYIEATDKIESFLPANFKLINV